MLYFDNLSRDTADIYLAEGFSEEVMSRLGQIERLQVKSRTAVRRLRDARDPVTVGRSLGVAHLVSGSVLRERGRLRVTVELTRVASGNSVWARSFERPAEDIIAVESEIAESVAVNVGARLAPAERRRVEARPTRNAAAYDHLLRGRFQQNRRTTEALLVALREYEAALALDSLFVSALVGKATANIQLGSSYYTLELGEPREAYLLRGRVLAERAVRMDSMSAEAWGAVAMARRSSAVAARAVALDARNAEAHHIYALGLRVDGRDSAAILEFHRALALEAERPITLVNLGQVYLMRRQYAEARKWIDSAVALRPDAAFYYIEQGFLRLLVGDTAGARSAALSAAAHNDRLGQHELAAMIDARAGDTVSARRRLVALDSALARTDCFVSHDCLELAIAHAQVGERDKALAMLERLTPRAEWLAYWLQRPELDIIRSEPRFQRLMTEARRAQNP